jgi:hypothetical protein
MDKMQEKEGSVESLHKDPKEGRVSANYMDKMQEKEGSVESLHKDPKEGRVSANYINKMREKGKGQLRGCCYFKVDSATSASQNSVCT